MRTITTIAALSLMFMAAHAEAGKACGCGGKPSASAPSPTPAPAPAPAPTPAAKPSAAPSPAPAPAPSTSTSGRHNPLHDQQYLRTLPPREDHLPPPTFPQPDPGPEPEPEPPREPIVIWSPPYVVTMTVPVPFEVLVPVERTENVCPVEPVKPKPARRSTGGNPAGVCK